MSRNLVGTGRGIGTALGVALALCLVAPAHAAPVDPAGAPEGSISVEVLAANGSGCAPGTARVVAQPDGSGFRIRYFDFVASAGGGTDPAASRRNCQLGVLVTVPAGWTFAVATADYRGRAAVPAGAAGLQRTNYYWQGSSDSSRTEETFDGPYHGLWSTRDAAPVLSYLPCGQQRVLNINTELRVDAGTSAGITTMSMTSTDADIDTLFNLAWQRC
ncbi:DUF4360 domain-containing protein [Solwaraspora sp. WMMA2101]|uniref:DUF4360 domain-containing protein n=1 Tax=Solwaraspora sp. WMMA2101 TaxID=3404124 RepID=UPI003B967080